MFVDRLAEETFEPYSYVGNNPIMFTDPTGMSKEGGGDPKKKRDRSYTDGVSLVFSNSLYLNHNEIIKQLGPKGNAVLGKHGLKILKYSKAVGVVGTVVGVGYSAYKISEGTATTIDYVDAGVGTASLVATVFLASNPVGWAIGAVAGHEIVHATDENEINKDLQELYGTPRKDDGEEKPNKVGKTITEQSLLINTIIEYFFGY